MTMKLMRVTEAERALLLKQRESFGFVDQLNKMMEKGRKQREALIASPPPPGYPYRCKECGAGTHAEDLLCGACPFL